MGFSRQEYENGLPCPPPGDLPNPGTKPRSPALQVDSLLSEPPGKAMNTGVGSRSLFSGNFPTQESNWGLLYCRCGENNGTPLQYSCLENPVDGRAWWATVHEVVKSWTRLSSFSFTFHFHELEKEMATHSNVLALRIPGRGEPGGQQSMGSHRVGHD